MESLDLYKLNWKHLDPEVRKQKLKSIEDQSVLTEIAKTDSSLSIRRGCCIPNQRPDSIGRDRKNCL